MYIIKNPKLLRAVDRLMQVASGEVKPQRGRGGLGSGRFDVCVVDLEKGRVGVEDVLKERKERKG